MLILHELVKSIKADDSQKKIDEIMSKAKELADRKNYELKKQKVNLDDIVLKNVETKKSICDSILLPYFKFFNNINNINNQEIKLLIEDSHLNIVINQPSLALENLKSLKESWTTKTEEPQNALFPLFDLISQQLFGGTNIFPGIDLLKSQIPILNILDIFGSARESEKQLEEAYQIFDEIKIETSKITTHCVFLKSLHQHLTFCMKTMLAIGALFTNSWKSFSLNNKNYASYTELEKKKLMILHSLANVLYELVQQPVLDKNNKIAEESKKLLENAKNVLNHYTKQ